MVWGASWIYNKVTGSESEKSDTEKTDADADDNAAQSWMSKWWYGDDENDAEATIKENTVEKPLDRTGFLGHLTKKHQQALDSLKYFVFTVNKPMDSNNQKEDKDQTSSDPVLTDEQLKYFTLRFKGKEAKMLCFLRKNDFDVVKSVKAFRQYLIWRWKAKIDEMVAKDMGKLLKNTVIKFCPFNDKKNRPILICQVGLHVPGDYEQSALVAIFVFIMEIIDAKIEAMGEVDQLDLCVIYDDWGYKNIDSNLDKIVLNLGKLYYPGTLGVCRILNPPWIFRGAWKVVSVFIDEKTFSKILMYGPNFKKQIQEGIHLDTLPPILGGTAKMVSIEDYFNRYSCLLKFNKNYYDEKKAKACIALHKKEQAEHDAKHKEDESKESSSSKETSSSSSSVTEVTDKVENLTVNTKQD